jgi:hypothetical protein
MPRSQPLLETRPGRAPRGEMPPADGSAPRLALPVGPCEAPTGRRRPPTRSPSGSFASPTGKNQVPLGGRSGASGSCKARLEKRVGAARRPPSPGPTRTSHWEARHYRARATSSGVPSKFIENKPTAPRPTRYGLGYGTHHPGGSENLMLFIILRTLFYILKINQRHHYPSLLCTTSTFPLTTVRM